jgi:hypothetical protein
MKKYNTANDDLARITLDWSASRTIAGMCSRRDHGNDQQQAPTVRLHADTSAQCIDTHQRAGSERGALNDADIWVEVLNEKGTPIETTEQKRRNAGEEQMNKQ